MVINYRFSKFTVFNKFGDDNADLDLMVAAPRLISVARLAGSACWLGFLAHLGSGFSSRSAS
jgi:hypothetical protein